MPLIKFKSNVVVPKVCIIVAAVINAATELGLPDMVVTSGNDSVHAQGSKHYVDAALDIRTKHLTTEHKHALVRVVKRRLGQDYDVLLEHEGGEQEHAHIEWDRKN